MKNNVALWTAVIALLALGAGVVYLASWVGADALSWARLQYLFGAIEALAFAAAGWLWGKEVHRGEAAAAAAAQQAARAAIEARGKAEGMLTTLADAVIAHANDTASRENLTSAPVGSPSLAPLAGLAARIRERL